MKINALLIILIYFQFFFCFDLIKASKTKSEINLKESIHFAEKLSNIKVNKSDKKRNPSMDDETNEFTEETETDKKDNQKKSKDNKELITSENNSNIIINERKKFLDDTKNLPKNKNSATINSIDNSDYIGIGLDKIESYDYLKISDLGPGPIFASGWIKYFKFKANSKDNKNIIDNDSKSTLQIIETEQSKNLPKSFIMNMEYEQEKRLTPQNDYNSKSSDGINILNDYIQDKYLFYAILMKDAFNIVSSRKGAVKKTYETIDIKFFSDISENYSPSKDVEEGLQEYGYFSEGYCFKINLTNPKDESYVICCDEEVFLII